MVKRKSDKNRVNIPIRSGVETFSGSTEYPKKVTTPATNLYPNGPCTDNVFPMPLQTISLKAGDLGLELATYSIFMMAGTIFGFFIARVIMSIP